MALVDPAQEAQLKSLMKMKSKFGAKAVRAEGVFFASKKEYRRWCELKLLRDAGDPRSRTSGPVALEGQRVFDLYIRRRFLIHDKGWNTRNGRYEGLQNSRL